MPRTSFGIFTREVKQLNKSADLCLTISESIPDAAESKEFLEGSAALTRLAAIAAKYSTERKAKETSGAETSEKQGSLV